MKGIIKTIIVIAILLYTINLSVADIIVFDQYTTSFEYVDDSLVVEKQLRLKNVGPSPIIPGEIHFKISEDNDGETTSVKVNNFEVVSTHGTKLESKNVDRDMETDLVFTIWDPLLPQFHYDFVMKYEINFDPKGILFHQINIPNEKTTIPIKDGQIIFNLPKKFHVTHAPDADIEVEDDFRKIVWDKDSDIKFEYSFLPLPKMGIPMVNVFWILVIIIFVLIFLVRIVKSQKNEV